MGEDGYFPISISKDGELTITSFFVLQVYMIGSTGWRFVKASLTFSVLPNVSNLVFQVRITSVNVNVDTLHLCRIFRH